MKKIKLLIVLFILIFFCNGCAVFMAMHGKKDANVGILNIGQDRSVVLVNLGQPTKTVASDTGRMDVFELQRGNTPSGGRALAHGALDLLTFGFWEIIGTPIEAMQGETYTLTIEYDANDKVTKIFTTEGKIEGTL